MRLSPAAHYVVNLTFALALAAAGAVGCEPSAHFPDPEQPLVGTVLIERQVTTGAVDTALDMGAARVVIPAAAVPAGTTLTVRLVTDIVKTIPDAGPLTYVWMRWGHPVALQIVPDTAVFALPLRATFVWENYFGGDGRLRLLHAAEDDTAWEITDESTISFLKDPPPLVGALTGPGLWTMVFDPVFQAQLVPGPYLRTSLSCDGAAVLAAVVQTITLGRDGAYVWGRGGAAGCDTQEQGTFVADETAGSIVFTPAGATAAPARTYGLTFDANGFSLTSVGAGDLDCAVGVKEAQTFASGPGGCGAP